MSLTLFGFSMSLPHSFSTVTILDTLVRYIYFLALTVAILFSVHFAVVTCLPDIQMDNLCSKYIFSI